MSCTCPASHQSSAEASTSVISAGLLQRSCDCGQHTSGGEECDECAKKKMALQRRSSGTAPRYNLPRSVQETLGSAGQPLDSVTKRLMEPQFGYDLSHVRVHTDPSAAHSARSLNALAYTVGHDVVFASGQYQPHSLEGRHLLAHELTHVVQQSKGAISGILTSGNWRIGASDDAWEQQAEATATRISGDRSRSPESSRIRPLPSPMSNTLQRKPTKGASSGKRTRTARRARPVRAAAPKAAVVEDNQRPQAGQMTRTQFLSTLREHLIRDCDAELTQSGRTAHGCPYILRTIDYYKSRPLAALLRLARVFGSAPPNADANGLIRAVTERARLAARRLAASGGQRAQRKAQEPGHGTPRHEPAPLQAQLGAGHRLDGRLRSQMEQSFGASFADIRIHTDGAANRLSESLDARAFTIGNDIAFAVGQYRPGTLPGDALIAHELAHTVQQSPPGRGNSGAAESDLENQADRAAVAALAGREGVGQSLRGAGPGLHVQRDGVGEVALAVALLTAEVGTDVAVEEGVVVVVTDVAAPAVVDVAAPAALDVALPAAVDVAAPAAVESVAPAAATAVSSSSAVSTTVAATALASTTLVSDSPTTEEENPQRKCLEKFPTALHCEEEIGMEEQVQEFLLRQGYGYEALGECQAESSIESVEHCNGAPGESWHCNVAPYSDPISKTSRPGGVVSIFGCLCCRTDGTTGLEWRGAHWSPGK